MKHSKELIRRQQSVTTFVLAHHCQPTTALVICVSGVLIVEASRVMRKRSYRNIRIPGTVYERIIAGLNCQMTAQICGWP
jgi:hypothetical protein